MSRFADTIDIYGKHGQIYRISGPGQGQQGFELAPGSTGLLQDAPVKTTWHKTMFGMSMSGMEWERRDIVWTVNIGVNLGLDPLRDPDEWHDLYDEWRRAFSYTHDTKIVYGSADGDRVLYARLLETPKPFSAHQFEGGDPKRWSMSSIVMTMACEFPFYIGPSEVYEWEFEGSGLFWTRIPHYNPSDVPIWPTYECTWGARWHIPDFSWGNEEFGRGQADLDKIVRTPELQMGENIEIQTRPDLETYQAENDAPVGLRANGRDFEYPILPGEGDPNPANGAVFMADRVVDGGALRATYPRWYSSPYSRPRLFDAINQVVV
ncbi:minor tail protein [Mycobacterium phage LittleLaf]|uniref:Minor tail protein n=14 Tax=Marvinvirus TaxID=1982091 RepID=A0A3S9U995_9CAUD|nr:minor tail protein [Mycobacterium phage MosMoris]YP_009614165.1 hypothetical protein FDI61_gp047 [Mycobacterium phage Marvin]ANM46271.1 minor tail protein [Mycobacterium phage Gattaca]AVE00794.1 minor tail protein [Mycobacterium phage Tesla]AYB69855.1 minor tail protein [Mycobacterium phage LittleLaf]AYB70684.1 minor tail protein [Mycobacterium phage VasuNzinga]AZF93317.1 minor tail protein [Mycobacterium phage Beelzebub]AZS06813.1 minor tail protein [Mycobacterium phage Raela]QAX93100.1